MLQIAGVRREQLYSPNHVGNDAMIFMKTVEHLTELGAEVKIYEEQDLEQVEIREPFIFSMAQGVKGTKILLELEKQGKFVINSPQGSINSYRTNMVRILPEKGIPFPKSLIVSIQEKDKIKFEDFNARKIWIKRGDVHAVHREDVTLVYSEDERKSIFREFEKRGITEVVLQEHLDGDVIKFYAIVGSPLFHWYYLNGVNHTPFDKEKLVELAEGSAVALGLDVYGGDAVVSQDGSISIIDINDWPSFAPIRDEASEQIAKLIFQKVKNLEKQF
jgi:Glutathione synthase/Ribosomal protein S6 modification enzyme (glutaminyl transferase)